MLPTKLRERNSCVTDKNLRYSISRIVHSLRTSVIPIENNVVLREKGGGQDSHSLVVYIHVIGREVHELYQ